SNQAIRPPRTSLPYAARATSENASAGTSVMKVALSQKTIGLRTRAAAASAAPGTETPISTRSKSKKASAPIQRSKSVDSLSTQGSGPPQRMNGQAHTHWPSSGIEAQPKYESPAPPQSPRRLA